MVADTAFLLTLIIFWEIFSVSKFIRADRHLGNLSYAYFLHDLNVESDSSFFKLRSW